MADLGNGHADPLALGVRAAPTAGAPDRWSHRWCRAAPRGRRPAGHGPAGRRRARSRRRARGGWVSRVGRSVRSACADLSIPSWGIGSPGALGGVAEWFRQGPAKPRTAVRFRPPPPGHGPQTARRRGIWGPWRVHRAWHRRGCGLGITRSGGPGQSPTGSAGPRVPAGPQRALSTSRQAIDARVMTQVHDNYHVVSAGFGGGGRVGRPGPVGESVPLRGVDRPRHRVPHRRGTPERDLRCPRSAELGPLGADEDPTQAWESVTRAIC